MSRKLFAFLLRLYPPNFREEYGDEYLRLLRDRARDETGILGSGRLGFDLIVDLIASLPREYRLAHAAPVRNTAVSSDVPTFFSFDDAAPGRGPLLFGALVSLITLMSFPILANHFGNLQPPHGWNYAPAGMYEEDGSDRRPLSSGRQQATVKPQQSAAPQTRDEGIQTKDEPFDAATRHRIVTNLIASLKQHYDDRAVAEKAATALRVHEQNGDYNRVSSAADFAQVLTSDLRHATDDNDLEIVFTRRMIPDRPRASMPQPPPAYAAEMQRLNCTFEKVEILPHNIGYVKLNSFPHSSVCQETATAALAKVNNADAVIVDLRDNRGGFPGMVKLIANYLFDHPEYLYSPIDNITKESWTNSPVAGSNLIHKPIFVLTSSHTISAAEEFTFNLKMLKRAVIIGETTAGGAHAASLHAIGDNLYLGTVDVRPINPYSKHDWNQTGIEPDVKVSGAEALNKAEELAERNKRK